jgi:hypothetical protein
MGTSEDPARPEARGPGDAAGPLAAFDEHRPLLFSIAYRMLGSVVVNPEKLGSMPPLQEAER